MANYQREVYQPSFEDGPTYDLRDDEVEDARARLPLLIVIALLVLASFAGVVWLAYNQGLERGLVGSPTVIAAPEMPIRTLPPEDSEAVAYTGLKIYNDPVPPDEEAEASALAQAPVIEAPPVAPTPLPQILSAQAASPPAAMAQAPIPAAAPLVLAPSAPPPAASPQAATSGGAVIQVGAYPSEDLAIEAWENFRAQFATIANGRSRDIQVADLGERGVWYRVRIGPYADNGTASADCDRLKAEGGNCFVAAP